MKTISTKQKIISIIIMLMLAAIAFRPHRSEAEINRFNMSYIYFGNSGTYLKYVEQTKDSLQAISPSYFDLNDDGSLKLTRSVDKSFISEMHKKNIKVIPFLSNHWNRAIGRAALENREKLVDEIVKVIEEYKLDGVNVDIENVTEADRDNYTDFVRLLRGKLPSNKEISVAVAANPRGFNVGWHGSYDYSELAKYSDYLLVMAYDESYYGSSAGPVASYSFVEKSIKYALDRVPAEKIVLGIPFYGRYWNSSENTGGSGISLADVDVLIQRFNGKVTFDKTSKSPKATFTISPNDEKYYVYGNELTPGNYTVWFENEESIKNKLELVQKYNLKGTGSWSLGQELPETWSYYKLWLNSKYFIDIQQHWGKDDILYVANKGWMKGTSSIKFSPDGKLTRAQAVVTLVRAMDLEGQVVNEKNSFPDVSKNHWAYKEIQIAKETEIIKGMENGKFYPNDYITREQMTALISRIIDYDTSKIDYKNSFSDIDTSRWSYKSIMEMNSLGVFEGYNNGLFMPQEKITRAQMAAVMTRISEYLDSN